MWCVFTFVSTPVERLGGGDISDDSEVTTTERVRVYYVSWC